MIMITEALFFIGGFSFVYLILLACDSPPHCPQHCPNANSNCTGLLCWKKCQDHFVKNKHRYLIGLSAVILLVTIFYFFIFTTGYYKPYDWLVASRIGKFILLLLCGCSTAVIFNDFSDNVKRVWEISTPPNTDNKIQPLQLRYLIIEGGMLLMAVLGIYAVFGMSPAIKTDYFSLELSKSDLVNPSSTSSLHPYQIKTELFQVDDITSYAPGIPCAIEGDIAFFQLKKDPYAIKLMKEYRFMVKSLVMLLNKASYLKQQGESTQRITQALNDVKQSLVFLLQSDADRKEKNKELNDKILRKIDDKELARLNNELIPCASDKLDKLNIVITKLKPPSFSYEPKEYVKPKWCVQLENEKKISSTSGNDQRYPTNANNIKNSPYIYIITSLMCWLDGDLKGAIKLIRDRKTEELPTPDYVKDNLNTAKFMSLMMMANNESRLDDSLQYTEEYKRVAEADFKELNNINEKSILKPRYEKTLFNAKNDLAYQMVRKENLNDKEAETAKKLAEEAYESEGGNNDEGYIDTLGAVRMIVAFRLLSGDKQHEEIEAARRLLATANKIASDNYDTTRSLADFSNLKIIEGHLREAENYLETKEGHSSNNL